MTVSLSKNELIDWYFLMILLILQNHLLQGLSFTDCFHLHNSSRQMILYFMFYIFSLPCYFSCYKVCTLAFRSMAVIYPYKHYHDRAGKSRTVSGIYPAYIRLLLHLVRNKSEIIFLYFSPNNWAIEFYLSSESLGKYYNFPGKSNNLIIIIIVIIIFG